MRSAYKYADEAREELVSKAKRAHRQPADWLKVQCRARWEE